MSNDNPLNRSHTDPLNANDRWAKEAVRSLLDICGLNASVVAAGLFPTYIHEMLLNGELLQFKRFLNRMLIGRLEFLKVYEPSAQKNTPI